jgi:transcriptional regulator with XRE-family HTH domain
MARHDPETNPAAFLGGELRRARVAAGFSSQDALAARLGFDRTVITKAETGDRPPTVDVLAAWCQACRLDDELFGRLGTLARRADGSVPAWFEDWVRDIEAAAATLRWFEPLLVPGLLQTEPYARALYATRVGLSTDDINALVAARLARQGILAREEPPMLWVILDEGVVRRPVGGRDVMAEQVRLLHEAAYRPTIRIEIIPAAIGAHDGLAGAFIIADLPGQPGAAAYREGARQGQVVTGREQVTDLMTCWDTLRSEAISRSDSLALLEEAAKSWT